ncbi:MAG: GIY-YIG nuclease family protein, partial [Ktedonobacteraceae bacterium]
MDRETLRKLIEDDDLGLLTVKPKVSAEASAAERLRASFLEIADFVRKNGREPAPNKADIKEMMLYSRLSGLRQDPKKVEVLREFDEFGLLSEVKLVESIEDVFSDDNLGLLADGTESIFALKNVPATKPITNSPEYIAKRKPCDDFANFEHLFKKCQTDLSTGKRTLIPFSRGTQIPIGHFFVLKGVLVYVA